jgi:hypothetical protein
MQAQGNNVAYVYRCRHRAHANLGPRPSYEEASALTRDDPCIVKHVKQYHASKQVKQYQASITSHEVMSGRGKTEEGHLRRRGEESSEAAASESTSAGGSFSALQPGQRGQLERTGAWHFQHGNVSSRAAPASSISSSCAAAPVCVSESLDLHDGHRGQPCLH